MSPEQMSNLKELRALGARILAEPERHPLMLALGECSTHACWLGWYRRHNGIVVCDLPFYDLPKCAEHFGITVSQAQEMFGTRNFKAGYTELERRLAILDNIIAQHDPQPKGIPSSVRAIFDVETA